MARGRPPSPDALNYLKGDPGKRRRYSLTPTGPEGVPEAPDYLDDVAAAEWVQIVPLLADMGVLSKIDGSAIVSYCEAWSRYRYAAEYVTANGFDGAHYRQASKAVADNQALCKAYLIEFGCTPAARARMKVQPQEKPKASKWAGVLRIAE